MNRMIRTFDLLYTTFNKKNIQRFDLKMTKLLHHLQTKTILQYKHIVTTNFSVACNTVSLSMNSSPKKLFYVISFRNFSRSNLASNTRSSLLSYEYPIDHDIFLPLLWYLDGTSPLVLHSYLQGSVENDPNGRISSGV